MFFNFLSMAKAEILKVEDTNTHKPLALEAIAGLEAFAAKFGTVLSYFDAADVEAFLPASVKAKIPPTLLTEFTTEFTALPGQLKAAEATLANLQKSLEAK